MCRQGNATPGEYASERSSWVASALVAETASFPGWPSEWKRSASSSLTRTAETSLVDTGVSPCIARGNPKGTPALDYPRQSKGAGAGVKAGCGRRRAALERAGNRGARGLIAAEITCEREPPPCRHWRDAHHVPAHQDAA